MRSSFLFPLVLQEKTYFTGNGQYRLVKSLTTLLFGDEPHSRAKTFRLFD